MVKIMDIISCNQICEIHNMASLKGGHVLPCGIKIYHKVAALMLKKTHLNKP